MTLDLKQPAAQEIIKELARQSDILVENFKHGTLEKLGLGYDDLSAINPRLIWANISGYGPQGPSGRPPGLRLHCAGRGRDHGHHRRG